MDSQETMYVFVSDVICTLSVLYCTFNSLMLVIESVFVSSFSSVCFTHQNINVAPSTTQLWSCEMKRAAITL